MNTNKLLMRASSGLAILAGMSISLDGFAASIPQRIAYQGYLSTGNSGLTGSYNMRITLTPYNSSVAGATCAQEFPGVPITNGLFQVILDTKGTQLPANCLSSAFLNLTSYNSSASDNISVKVELDSDNNTGNGYERSFTGINLNAVPYAYVAQQCNSVTPQSITPAGFAIAGAATNNVFYFDGANWVVGPLPVAASGLTATGSTAINWGGSTGSFTGPSGAITFTPSGSNGITLSPSGTGTVVIGGSGNASSVAGSLVVAEDATLGGATNSVYIPGNVSIGVSGISITGAANYLQLGSSASDDVRVAGTLTVGIAPKFSVDGSSGTVNVSGANSQLVMSGANSSMNITGTSATVDWSASSGEFKSTSGRSLFGGSISVGGVQSQTLGSNTTFSAAAPLATSGKGVVRLAASAAITGTLQCIDTGNTPVDGELLMIIWNPTLASSGQLTLKDGVACSGTIATARGIRNGVASGGNLASTTNNSPAMFVLVFDATSNYWFTSSL